MTFQTQTKALVIGLLLLSFGTPLLTQAGGVPRWYVELGLSEPSFFQRYSAFSAVTESNLLGAISETAVYAAGGFETYTRISDEADAGIAGMFDVIGDAVLASANSYIAFSETADAILLAAVADTIASRIDDTHTAARAYSTASDAIEAFALSSLFETADAFVVNTQRMGRVARGMVPDTLFTHRYSRSGQVPNKPQTQRTVSVLRDSFAASGVIAWDTLGGVPEVTIGAASNALATSVEVTEGFFEKIRRSFATWFGGDDTSVVEETGVQYATTTVVERVIERTTERVSGGVSYVATNSGVSFTDLALAIQALRADLEDDIDLAMDSPKQSDGGGSNKLSIEDGPEGYLLSSTGNDIEWVATSSLGISGGVADGSFSTTSAEYWQSVSNFFATTSADYWLTQQTLSSFSTTSADYWQSVRNFFSTTSADAYISASSTIANASGVASGNVLQWNGTRWVSVATTTLGLGTGNVTSTSTVTGNAIARFDGTTGQLIQNSAVTIDDSGNLGVGTGQIQVWDAASPSNKTIIAAVGSGGTRRTEIRVGHSSFWGLLGDSADIATWSGLGVGLASTKQLGWQNTINLQMAFPVFDTGLARSSAGVLRVTDGSSGGGALMADYFTATSTTATSTFAGDIKIGADTGLARSAAGVLNVTDGSTGLGNLKIKAQAGTTLSLSLGADLAGLNGDANGLYLRGTGVGAVSVDDTAWRNFWGLGYRVASDGSIGFSNTTNPRTGTPDIGLARSSAGVLKVTDGSTGNGAILVGTAFNAPTGLKLNNGSGHGAALYGRTSGVLGFSNLAGTVRLLELNEGGAAQLASDVQLIWDPNTKSSGATFADTGLARSAAGVLRVTNGGSGGGALKAEYFTATSTATSTIPTLSITGLLYDSSNTGGTSGMVLKSTGTGIQWVATSTLGISGGASQWTTSGSNIYYTTGNVGIGDSTPVEATLRVVGATATSTGYTQKTLSILGAAGYGGNGITVGGEGSLLELIGGVGGDGYSDSSDTTGGVGGRVVITAGVGGSATDASGNSYAETGGGGGTVLITGGTGGYPAGQGYSFTQGAGGHVVISSGLGAVPGNVYIMGTSTGQVLVSGGKFGFGTSTPFKTFSVQGTVALNGLTAASGASPSALCLKTGGEVVVNTGAQTCTVSSLRFKHDVTEFVSGLSTINALSPSVFVYNDTTEERIGLIAEEVAVVDDRLIFREQDGTPRGVRYEDIVAVLVKAVQELSVKVDLLMAGAGQAVDGVLSGIKKLIVQEEICIGETCVNETQLQQLLENANITPITPPVEEPPAEEPPTEEPPAEEPPVVEEPAVAEPPAKEPPADVPAPEPVSESQPETTTL